MPTSLFCFGKIKRENQKEIKKFPEFLSLFMKQKLKSSFQNYKLYTNNAFTSDQYKTQLADKFNNNNFIGQIFCHKNNAHASIAFTRVCDIH